MKKKLLAEKRFFGLFVCFVILTGACSLAGWTGCRPTGPSKNADDNQFPHDFTEFPYKFVVEPVTNDRDNLTIAFTVENVTRRGVGWDSEFSAALMYHVRTVPSDLADGTANDLKRQNHLEAVLMGRVPEADRVNRSRFVMLKPGERLTKQIRLAEKFRQMDGDLRSLRPKLPMTMLGTESFFRFDIPRDVTGVDVSVQYISRSSTLLHDAFGVASNEVQMWQGEEKSSETLRIEFR